VAYFDAELSTVISHLHGLLSTHLLIWNASQPMIFHALKIRLFEQQLEKNKPLTIYNRLWTTAAKCLVIGI